MLVEVFSDVVCPWCYIGKRRFDAAVEEFEATTGETVDVRYRAFMLDPTAPDDPEPVRRTYEKKFGGPEAADRVLRTVTAEAAGEGLDFDMDIAMRANTRAAHRLLVLAAERGCQGRLKELLMKAYFTDGGNLAAADQLRAAAVEAGLDGAEVDRWLDEERGEAEVSASLAFCAENGITSVPTYVFDRRVAVPGAQPSATFARLLSRVAGSEGPPQLFDPS
jgi:predicted DsbA family dithiol-disulfide isomerase